MAVDGRFFAGPLWSVALCAALTMPSPPGVFARGGEARDRFDHFLDTHLDLSGSEIAAVHRGTIVTTDMPAGDPREIVVAGIARMPVSPEFFADRVRDVEDFRRGPNVRAVRAVSRPPREADFSGFVLAEDDLNDLRSCRVERCTVKFDARALERFAREVDWSADNARAEANRIVRETLHGYFARYDEAGRAALPVISDREEPIARAHEVAGLTTRTRVFDEHFPAVRQYLEAFPARRDARAADLYYWSQEVFGLKPVANLTHMTLWHEPGAFVDWLIVSQQLYASHYFDGSLAVTLLFRDDEEDDAGVFVVYINRTLGDGLRGWLGGIKRAIAKSRARDGLRDTLTALRNRMESLSRAPGPGRQRSPQGSRPPG